MVNKRDLKLSDHNISRAKYLELKYFCLQYNEKKKELQHSYGLRSTNSDGQPHGNGTSSPTERQAMKNAMLQEDIALIEQTAMTAAPDYYQCILKNVTEETTYEGMNVPCGRRQFYEARRYFFFLLAQKR